jgi:ATP sulfurylase
MVLTSALKQMESDAQSQLISEHLQPFSWRKETTQMLGRWQPFHDGHLALFERALAKTGQVAIQVRDCQGWNDSNPFDFDFVKEKIIEKLSEHGYTHNNEYTIMLVPNMSSTSPMDAMWDTRSSKKYSLMRFMTSLPQRFVRKWDTISE